MIQLLLRRGAGAASRGLLVEAAATQVASAKLDGGANTGVSGGATTSSLRDACLNTASAAGFRSHALPAVPAVVPAGGPAACGIFRGISSFPAAAAISFEPDTSLASAKAVLHQLNVQELKEELAEVSNSRLTLSNEELTEMIKKHGMVETDGDVATLIDALDVAGVILRFKGAIYLKPEEVAEVVLASVPESADTIKHKLFELEEELKPLEAELSNVESSAQRRTNVFVWLGLGALVAQFAVFVRFTYWEFSWDVMEPMAYFCSQAFGIATYLYFMYTREEFAYSPWRDRVHSKSKARVIQASSFNADRYEQLIRTIGRYRRYLAHARP